MKALFRKAISLLLAVVFVVSSVSTASAAETTLKKPTISVTVDSNSNPKISITNDVADATHYAIYRLDLSTGKFVKIVNTAKKTYIDKKWNVKKNGHTKYYAEAVIIADKKLTDSSAASAEKTTLSQKVTLKAVYANSKTAVKLTWTDSVGNVSYIVQRKAANETKYTQIATVTKKSYTDTPPKAGKYVYRILPKTKTKSGNYWVTSNVASNKVSATTVSLSNVKRPDGLMQVPAVQMASGYKRGDLLNSIAMVMAYYGEEFDQDDFYKNYLKPILKDFEKDENGNYIMDKHITTDGTKLKYTYFFDMCDTYGDPKTYVYYYGAISVFEALQKYLEDNNTNLVSMAITPKNAEFERLTNDNIPIIYFATTDLKIESDYWYSEKYPVTWTYLKNEQTYVYIGELQKTGRDRYFIDPYAPTKTVRYNSEKFLNAYFKTKAKTILIIPKDYNFVRGN